MPRRYSKEEIAYLMDLVAKHGREYSWADVVTAFRVRFDSRRPKAGILEKAKTIKYQLRKARRGYEPRDEYISVQISDLVRLRKALKSVIVELTALIGTTDGE